MKPKIFTAVILSCYFMGIAVGAFCMNLWCEKDKKKNAPMQKPFIVIDKDVTRDYYWGENTTKVFYHIYEFTYQDKNGKTSSFELDEDRYHIGDTLK